MGSRNRTSEVVGIVAALIAAHGLSGAFALQTPRRLQRTFQRTFSTAVAVVDATHGTGASDTPAAALLPSPLPSTSVAARWHLDRRKAILKAHGDEVRQLAAPDGRTTLPILAAANALQIVLAGIIAPRLVAAKPLTALFPDSAVVSVFGG